MWFVLGSIGRMSGVIWWVSLYLLGMLGAWHMVCVKWSRACGVCQVCGRVLGELGTCQVFGVGVGM
jgi:hypothetical protein